MREAMERLDLGSKGLRENADSLTSVFFSLEFRPDFTVAGAKALTILAAEWHD
jgi:hypothetical protein